MRLLLLPSMLLPLRSPMLLQMVPKLLFPMVLVLPGHDDAATSCRALGVCSTRLGGYVLCLAGPAVGEAPEARKSSQRDDLLTMCAATVVRAASRAFAPLGVPCPMLHCRLVHLCSSKRSCSTPARVRSHLGNS